MNSTSCALACKHGLLVDIAIHALQPCCGPSISSLAYATDESILCKHVHVIGDAPCACDVRQLGASMEKADCHFCNYG